MRDRHHFRLLLPALHALAGAASAPAGDSPHAVTAVRVLHPPEIDGRLSDPVRRLAEPATDFVRRDPEAGVQATEPTEVRIVYDDDALCVGCLLSDSDPQAIVSRLTRRDNEVDSDRFLISLDTFHDRQTCYGVSLNVHRVLSTNSSVVVQEEAWVENRATPSGLRSILGDWDTEEVAVTARSAVTVTRDLAMQLYGRLFAGRGRKDRFPAPVTPEVFEPVVQETSAVSFGQRSYTADLVMRWEYLPGSALFLVWSHARVGDGTDMAVTIERDLREAFRSPLQMY